MGLTSRDQAGDRRGIIYVQGEKVANVPEEQILDALLNERFKASTDGQQLPLRKHRWLPAVSRRDDPGAEGLGQQSLEIFDQLLHVAAQLFALSRRQIEGARPVPILKVLHQNAITGPRRVARQFAEQAGEATVGPGAAVAQLVVEVEQGLPLSCAEGRQTLGAARLARLQLLQQRIGWQEIKAVKDHRIIDDLNMDLLIRPGPRLTQGMRQLTDRLYPQEAGR